MGERLVTYRRGIDALLASPPEEADWEAIWTRHQRWVGYFQHERLAHLAVMLAVGLFALISVLSTLTARPGDALSSWAGLGLSVLLLGLLVPYIRHYFLLENNVQALYDQSDRLDELRRAHVCLP